ncbi:putative sugar O-methyltransferase [Ensifer canadensis]
MFSKAPSVIDDANLVRRVRAGYAASLSSFGGHGDSQWGLLNDWKGKIHHALLAGDEEATAVLRDPGASNFFWGFDVLDQERTERLLASEEAVQHERAVIEHAIKEVAVAVGASRINNPEAPNHRPPEQRSVIEDLDKIQKYVPFPVAFPNPFKDEFGSEYNGQFASVRAIYAIYQAYKTELLAKAFGCGSVLEIGGGLGRAAYYSFMSGITNYSIIDIPLTSAAQAYFLGRVLGEDKVALYGEEPREGAVRLLPPAAISEVQCDLTVNVDLFTEMDPAVAESYIDHALGKSKALFSINHEVNGFTVNEIIRSRRPDTKILRHGSPVRSGYMEEIVFIR